MNHLGINVHVVFHHHVQLVSLDNIGATTYNLRGTLENFDKIKADRQFKSVLMLKSVKRPNSSRPIS
jgi:hypothetical protein